jgi:phage terminase large subunit
VLLNLQVPRKLRPLLQPARYKGAHGGRGGAKSHFFAQLAVATNYARPARGVCIREVQNSIKDSVKQLIEDKISANGLDAFFEIKRDEIVGKNGSLMVFRGMQSYNAENIKSLEGFDWAWIEEAQTLSERSLRMLRPTIRKDGSEIWASWNPRHDVDAIDQFLRGAHKPEDAIVVEVNWNDNPWLPDVLRAEKDRDHAADPEMAEHVWGGGYEIVSEGAYLARWIATAEKEGRVGHFPYDPRFRLRTGWDLGIDDHTVIWFVQDDGRQATVVDFYEVNNSGFDDIIAAALPELFVPPRDDAKFIGWSRDKALAELDRTEPYRYACHYLPHDVQVRDQAAGGRHRFESLRLLGLQDIVKGVAIDPEERVAASRALLPSVRFNATPRVMHGLKRLRRYKRKFNELLGVYAGPLKDGNDHAADAFGEYAINADILPRVVKPVVVPPPKEVAVTIGPTGVTSNIDPDRLRRLNPKEFIDVIKRSRRANG